MTDIFNTGKSALFAFQRALSTTSHNIANVNTEGYSRQRVTLEAISTGNRDYEYNGTGVQVSDIKRIHDQFATARVNSATSDHSEQETHFQMASRLDNLVATDGISVSPAISEFFNAMQDANADASSIASRSIVIDKAEQLAQRFRSLQDQFDDAQVETNARLRAAVDNVNEYAKTIAEINVQVVSTGSHRQAHAANDLLDQRDQLIAKLSEHIEVSTVVQDNGAMNVYMGKGVRLVTDGIAEPIEAVADDTYPDRLQLLLGQGTTKLNLDAHIQGGEIGGLHDFTGNTLYPAMQELGRLSLVMADALNEQHAKGVDTLGDSGTALFETPEPQVFSSSGNTGSGVVTATIDDVNALEASDYLLRFDGANFTATRTSDGVQTTAPLPVTLDGMNLTLTGTPVSGDTFIVSATNRAAGSIESVITDPEKLALASQLSTSSDIANVGDSAISEASVTDPLAANLKDPIDIVFNTDNTFNIIDVNSGGTLSANVAYTPGDTVALNGWEVTLTGPARTGDTHRIENNVNGRGNNVNGLAMSELQDSNVVGGTQSFNDAYGSMVSGVGTRTHTAEVRTQALESLKSSAIDRQQSSQGVSLDEEAIDLTRYQQAYQASAQIIQTADTLFQSILGAIR